MELYHKIYKMNPDLTVYLDNPQKLVEHCDEMLSHLTGAREYSCAITPQVRQAGNRLSGLTETAYASLLA